MRSISELAKTWHLVWAPVDQYMWRNESWLSGSVNAFPLTTKELILFSHFASRLRPLVLCSSSATM